jgi:hypothetical protein
MGRNPTLECLSVSCVWVSVATSYHARPLGSIASQGPGLGCLLSIGGPLGVTVEGGCNVPGHGEVSQ